MSNQRKRHSEDFKSKIALEALKGLRTVNEIAGEHGIHPAQVSQWKKQLQEGVNDIFTGKRERVVNHGAEKLQDQLYQEIGRLKMELEWLKKSQFSIDEKRGLIEPDHHTLTIVRQCELLGLPRASYYYQAREVNETDLIVMRELDVIYTDYPFYGSRRMVVELKSSGYIITQVAT